MEGIEKKNRKLKKVSIILFIIIIFLGVFDILWYNNISNVDYKSVSNIEKFAISEIAGFNSQFTRYCGTQKGTVIKGLLSFVIESNNTNNHNVTIGIKDGSIWYNKDILNLMDKINLKSIVR